MDWGATSGLTGLLDALVRIEHELLLFAAFWFIVGAIDELAIDLCWLKLRVRGLLREEQLPRDFGRAELSSAAAVFIPAWQESTVIGATVTHALSAWPQRDLRLYIGCYRNDPGTVEAVMQAAIADPRVRIVVLDRDGPTTKADCLNRLYAALDEDERRQGMRYGSVLLHDAEDMVHPAALSLIDAALREVSFVQLPVRPEPQPESVWIAGHYTDEFTEAHAKTMPVRDAIGAAIPAAGVGCGLSREALGKLAIARGQTGEDGPFSSECLTEDYELGLIVSSEQGQGRFLRVRDASGALVATRACFPATLDAAVRQKTRWIHGIAFQGWDRLGWKGRPVDVWMRLRDRRGPLTAVVLAAAYALLVIEAVLALARLSGWREEVTMSPLLRVMLIVTFASFVWRSGWRFAFTAREYGVAEGVRSVLRIPIANIIAIMAGRRALVAYARTLRGAEVVWDKTHHAAHPAMQVPQGRSLAEGSRVELHRPGLARGVAPRAVRS